VGIYDQMVKDYGLELITTGIAPGEHVLQADSRGRLRLGRSGDRTLFGIPDPARAGSLRDGLGRMILPVRGSR
jgi:hypothetical protein